MNCKYEDCINYGTQADKYCCVACSCDDYDYQRLKEEEKQNETTD